LAIFLYVKFVEANSDWDYHGDPFNRILRVNRLFFDEDSFTCQHLMVLAYVGLSSLIASFTTLSIKSLGEIISRGIGGDTASLLHRSTLLFASSVVICTLLQIYWLNRALVRYDALLVVPIFHISWTLLSITTAGIYFQDFDHFSSHQFRMFLYALAVIFCGSLFLGARVVNKRDVRSRRIEIPEEEIVTNVG
ncbi:NIPA6, partial [Enterospora canceri]